ncbi:MAG: hypothetical protein QXP66_01020 [Candidatus Aenigmatarchaeota archaeon]
MKFHQGDIMLIQTKLPENVKKIRKNVIAFGEATGHAHIIKGADIYSDGTTEYAVILQESEMIHEEHPSIVIPAGIYEIRHQIEYWPGREPRKVKD